MALTRRQLKGKEWRVNNSGHQAAWRASHPGYSTSAQRKWRAAHPEYVAKWRAAHPGYDAAIRRRYRLKHPEHKKMWTKRKQERLAGRKKPKRCEACGKTGKKLCFDHCHKSRKFRGWICGNCNTALGQVKDSIKTLAKLIEYLERCKNGGAGPIRPK